MSKTRGPRPLEQPDFKTRVLSYLREHARVLLFSLGKLYRTPFATLMTTLMIAAALALPACLYILLNALQTVTNKWDDTGQITLFLYSESTEQQITQLENQLLEHEQIRSVEYIPADQALSELKQRSAFGELLDGLPSNPLPPALIVTPMDQVKNSERLNALQTEMKSLENVENVQLDMQWLRRFQSITAIMRKTVFVLGLMLGLSVLLVVSNSIRLDIENRRGEIKVTKLIGATDRFIRRPFLYGGMWFGLLGGILALILIFIVLLLIRQPTHELASLYNSDFKLAFPNLRHCLSLMLISISLGLFSSWFTVNGYLGKIQPN